MRTENFENGRKTKKSCKICDLKNDRKLWRDDEMVKI